MAWMRIDDRVRTHPKIVSAGPGASWFWFCGIGYCREHLTDGFIPDGMMASLCPGVGLAAARNHASKLVEVLLWHKRPGGYQVHDFLDWNPSRASVIQKREEERLRKEQERLEKENRRSGVRDLSGRTNEGVRTVEGDAVRADSSAGAAAHGSGSGLGSGGDQCLEESRETFSVGGGKPRPLIESPAKWGVIHGDHVTGFCDWKCFPFELLNQFATQLVERDGLTHTDATHEVEGWARSVRASGVMPTGKMFAFWNAQWEVTHGSSEPVKDGAAGRHARTAQRLSRFVEEG